ncbi:EscS/YscS/HrcS family type III secretion system export apparatus protein [Imbroritus primus]|jgi:type III secretion protein S|uniref:EscS/YscS/HrcS family type III secretion system export apparatus protein n=1 Tax=Imbroritus primus TaxID=3058603 RepID=A0ACD3SLI9_9BURK|nr:EscS/YscS/HrcS family type III secretion system export apparatus protein [Burkholderiaceae bacterium PBA]HVL10238.1 type III secretion system export apparatus subunit SctS [Burkholderiaceae bacterium]
METVEVVSYLTKALYLVLWLSLPPIIVASVIGTVFSLLQALTQIQEQTLAFGVKLIAVAITLFLTGRWLGGEMYHFTLSIFDALPLVAR